jgi:hypothetical protein
MLYKMVLLKNILESNKLSKFTGNPKHLKVCRAGLKLALTFITFVFILALVTFSVNFVAAQTACCEKTKGGAWCQTTDESECDSGFQSAPTSCESTSFCKLGCCFDSQDGVCMESTPQRICQDTGGVWSDDSSCNIAQCSLGCCVLGDQASLVTLTRCKQQAGFFGLETDFRADIDDELSCIALANSQDKGACVRYDSGTGINTCSFVTRAECSEADSQVLANISEVDALNFDNSGFYDDILCSADELGTDCGPSTETILLDGKDEVYYQDTCGNPANIYDADRFNDDIYWKEVFSKEESCGYGGDNSDSRSCGNCDYLLGSIGRKAPRLSNPVYGEFMCVNLDCEDRRHGESWCLDDGNSGDSKDSVGSRYFKNICIFNEVIIESCADFRNEICIEQETNGFSEARCQANKWQNCIDQEDRDDCENIDARDCRWEEGYYFSIEQGIQLSEEDNSTAQGLCVPNFPPGFQFWDPSSTVGGTSGSTVGQGEQTFPETTSRFSGGSEFRDAGSSFSRVSSGLCSLGSAQVTVKYKGEFGSIGDAATGILGADNEDLDWECVGNKKICELLGNVNPDTVVSDNLDIYVDEMNSICTSLGDCGGYINWVGQDTDDGFAAYLEGERFAGSGGSENLNLPSTGRGTGDFEGDRFPESSTTGFAIGDILRKITGVDK